ncbi:hypothetical protein K469DRAFT_731689 [Zopfia rhizophila CBS 207.26]|uniref:Uncharacterized protein n=1 Tax=Zopfia rhizophila CBS 207.26 TaxID=1314779 RepID=A0A6A6DHN8_9PEZI|nr:hypothetical protein K469DRAFT_731689 [Zopfia rhizophila CBS 207.26]
MAPVISKALHLDILNALQNAAKRRNKITMVRKEQQAKKLGAIKFIPPLDTDTTQANIYYIKRFIRFCHGNKHGPWIKAIKTKNCDKGFIMTFLVVNANNGKEIVKYINGTLRVEFNLDVLPKPKPVMGVNDLLLGLTYHWSRDRFIFPTEDNRLNSRGGKDPLLDEPGDQCSNGDSVSDSVVTSRNDIGDTEGDDKEIESDDREDDKGEDNNPVFNDTNGYDLYDTGSNNNTEAVDADNSNDTEVDEFGDPIRKHKVLCYEDITLWIVKNAKQGGRDILMMEVYFQYHKKADNKPKP